MIDIIGIEWEKYIMLYIATLFYITLLYTPFIIIAYSAKKKCEKIACLFYITLLLYYYLFVFIILCLLLFFFLFIFIFIF